MRHRVLVVEPWAGGSHAAWAETWQRNSRHDVGVIGLAARAWRWRMHGGAVTLAGDVRRDIAENGRPDVLVVSDMVDLSALVALLRRDLPGIPVALYLHENQITYPRQPDEILDRGLAWITWKNLVVADAVWCNSAFHRDGLLAALPALLRSVPCDDHMALLSDVAARMTVLPVPVELGWAIPDEVRPPSEAPLVISNQRWHHDKDVGAVLRALCRIAADGVEFRLAVLGDETGGEADVLTPLIDALGDRVVARGQPSRRDYEALLRRGDIVVSAARNEYFGIAVVEATAAGCVPVLPNALAYPETIPEVHHHAALYEAGSLRPALAAAIVDLDGRRRSLEGLAASMQRFAAPAMAALHDAAVERLVATPIADGR